MTTMRKLIIYIKLKWHPYRKHGFGAAQCAHCQDVLLISSFFQTSKTSKYCKPAT